jgi:hypothetical protein
MDGLDERLRWMDQMDKILTWTVQIDGSNGKIRLFLYTMA